MCCISSIINLSRPRRCSAALELAERRLPLSAEMLCLMAGGLWSRSKMTDWAPLAVLVLALCSGSVWATSEPVVTCEDTEESVSHPVIRAAGEVWTARNCVRGECLAVHAPDGSASPAIRMTNCVHPPSSKCREISPRNTSAEYPACCPRYECPGRCFSERLQRWFRAGEWWTERGCLMAQCSGSGSVSLLPCGLIGLEPHCRAVPGDPEAEYPDCCMQVECDEQPQCYDEQLDQHFAFGEKWTLSGCGGQATCGVGGAVSAVGCPLQATDTPGCGLDDGDASLGYPQCCPKITCKNCYSQRLDRYFGPGDTWTGGTCTANTCQAGPYGAHVQRRTCSPLGEPPYADCYLLDADLELGEFPQCCPVLRCPGRCQDGGRWYSVGQQWDSGCTRSICIGTGRVERLACPGLRYDPYRIDCSVVPGNSSAGFPACCDTLHCDSPIDECLDASDRRRKIGSEWMEWQCTRARCERAEGGVAVVRRTKCPPPPSADCRPAMPYGAAHIFPVCCPAFRCPGHCFSLVKARWFSVGEHWTEGECVQSTCEDGGREKHEPCPFVSANRPECSVVPGEAAADYPACCPRVECEQPYPYAG